MSTTYDHAVRSMTDAADRLRIAIGNYKVEIRELRGELGRENLVDDLNKFNEHERLKRLRLAEDILGHPVD